MPLTARHAPAPGATRPSHTRVHAPATTASSSSSTSSPATTPAQSPSAADCALERRVQLTTSTTTPLADATAPKEPSSSSSSLVLARSERARPVGVFSKRKGVRYTPDGRVAACRFCEILRLRDEPFLVEDDDLAVFRPLHPIAPSHILIVPRAHIRNVNQLTHNHVDLLRRMRAVAEKVLRTHPSLQATAGEGKCQPCGHVQELDVADMPTLTTDDEEVTANYDADDIAGDCRFAFHVPPFNSIDHVHMHAFRGSTGYFGRIKYRTKSWWCRSYDEVLARLDRLRVSPSTGQPPASSALGGAETAVAC